MLRDNQAMATVAVRDLAVAKRFYEEALGLQLVSSNEEALTYQSGDSTLVVYRSQYAGTNKATAATWNVGAEIEKVVQALKERGVPFEHYNMQGMTRQGDLHVAGDMKAAWMKDPDGNILALMNQ